MTASSLHENPLRQALPLELQGSGNRLFSYRRFPVFGIAWFWRRTLLALSVVSVFALLMAVSTLALDGAGEVAIPAALWLFFAFGSMCVTGPLLATLVRHAGLRPMLERLLVVAAITLGIIASYHADARASAYISRELRPLLEEPGTQRAATRQAPAHPLSRGRLFNSAILVAIYGTLGGAFALRLYFIEGSRLRELRNQRELVRMRESARQADLRLGLLQAQVEPHFLFNTLASVRALVRQDPRQAEAALDALVDYLRASIPRLREDAGSLASTLGQQLDRCASYLALMRVRMGPRFSYAIDVDAGLRELSFPPLLLITLVENAIKHGIEPKPGPGRVRVHAEKNGDDLHVCVTDDGVGLRAGSGTGMGLANVREQLALRYGERARFRLASAGSGAVAEIVVPTGAAS